MKENLIKGDKGVFWRRGNFLNEKEDFKNLLKDPAELYWDFFFLSNFFENSSQRKFEIFLCRKKIFLLKNLIQLNFD